MSLPKGWVAATVGDTARYINGLAFKPDDWGATGRPIIRIQNLTNPEKPFNRTVGEYDDEFIVKPGEILVSWSATLDAFLWEREEAVLNQHIFRVVPNEGIDKSFLFHLLRQAIAEMRLSEHLHGSTMKHINRGPFLAHEIGLPPVEEQRRIAEKLNAFFARTRTTKARLERLRALLENLKRSILASALSGDLTKDWRAANPNVEPATTLLARIRAERRRRWEDALRVKGRDPKKAVYDEPAAVDVDGLPDLPQGWEWASLDALVFDGPTNGYSPPSSNDGAGTKSLKLSATTGGSFRLDETTVKRLLEVVPAEANYWLEPGDILIQRANTLEYVGTSAIFNGPRHEYIYPDLMMRVRVSDADVRDWVVARLTNARLSGYFVERATGTAGNMPKINSTTVRNVPIPIPPAAELAKALSILAGFSLASITAHIEQAANLVERMERTALAKAFRGELVPQDPSDKPATELLDRVRTARRTEEPQRARRGRLTRPAEPTLFATTKPAPAVTSSLRLDSPDAVAAAFRNSTRLTATAIGAATGLDVASVRKALSALVDAGKVRVEGRARGTTYVWTG